MAFAKGKVHISEDKLIELLKLDENIEIVSVKHTMGEGLELNIASRMPIQGETYDVPNWVGMRRKSVPKEGLKLAKWGDILGDEDENVVNVKPRNTGRICDCIVNLGVVHNGATVVCAICEKPKG
jgi:hypothetical protein